MQRGRQRLKIYDASARKDHVPSEVSAEDLPAQGGTERALPGGRMLGRWSSMKIASCG